jgi:hypothetical protein
MYRSTMLRAIGFWITDIHDEEFCAPQEIAGYLAPSERSRLVEYLENGTVFESYRGCSWCRFYCDAVHGILGSRELTDGVWVWPEGLPHYVRNHEVILPEDFAAHSQRATMRPVEDPTLDFRFWKAWCATRRNAQIVERLRIKKAEFAREFERECSLRAEELEEKLGLSSEKCIWAGCRRNALAGKSICGLHGLGHEEARIRWRISDRLLKEILIEPITSNAHASISKMMHEAFRRPN